ncbi:Manganese/iron superoxide dismutase [Entophlyctis helioformis]|nr:Manganese/iron superoxide dismutase [Entophlyctis helioformis]
MTIIPAFGDYSLPPLPYGYDELEPHIDTATMVLHHTKHHQSYTDNLNKAIAALRENENGVKQLGGNNASLDDLLRRIAREDVGKESVASLWADQPRLRQAVRNHGGGYVNHILYFYNLSPKKIALQESWPIAKAIKKHFGSYDKFDQEFSNAALGVFGSGWVFLVWNPSAEKLQIVTTQNQDIPEFAPGMAGSGAVPVLALDVWEHAYYKKYSNVRANYVTAWWNIVNWFDVNRRFEDAAGISGTAVGASPKSEL